MGQQVVREQHGLGVLEVSAARHDRRFVSLGLSGNRIDEVDDVRRDGPGMIEQIEPNERRDLIVAAAPGAELAADLCPRDLDETALERGVHVFLARERKERSFRNPSFEIEKCARHRRQLGVTQVSRLGECLRMRPGPREIVGRQLPIEVCRSA